MIREGIKTCLGEEPTVEVVGEAADGVEALSQAHLLAPALILLDLSMPRLTGLETMAILRRELPCVRVLVLTMHHGPQYVTQVVQAGAHGYLAKSAPPSEMLAATLRVGRGGTYFSSEAAQVFLDTYVSGSTKNGSPSGRLLSQRECEVLALIASGLGNKEIGTRLGVGTRTVETHRERIMRKLDIHSVAGMTRYAIAQGIVALD